MQLTTETVSGSPVGLFQKINKINKHLAQITKRQDTDR